MLAGVARWRLDYARPNTGRGEEHRILAIGTETVDLTRRRFDHDMDVPFRGPTEDELDRRNATN